jgi:hypothetical protein
MRGPIVPTSHHRQINEIVGLILKVNPMTLLDIGIGFGKYGVLAREYLELWDGRGEYDSWKRGIDGIEVFKGYHNPIYSWAYNEVFFGDALEILPELNRRYDLVLMVDVLEHFTRDDGAALLTECKRVAKNVLISTPRVVSPQGEAFGNPKEAHVSGWTANDLKSFGTRYVVPNDRSLICLLEMSS